MELSPSFRPGAERTPQARAAAIGALLGILLLGACSSSPPATVGRLERDEHQLQRGRLAGESRFVLRGDDHRLDLRIPRDAVLQVGFSVPKQTPIPPGGIIFSAVFEWENQQQVLLRRTVGGAPSNLLVDTWYDFDLRLGGLALQSGQLHLSAHAADGSALPEEAVMWANPKVQTPNPRGGTNVILISIDTLRADRLGCYGSDRDTSPQIDRVAGAGIRFRRALAASNWTLPSHASMLTGLEPQRHGVLRQQPDALGEALDTLAEYLWRAGYETGGFVGGGFVDSSFGFDQGFDRYWTPRSQLLDSMERNTTTAMRWMERRLNSRFFVFLHSYQVHMPYDPPPPYDRMFDPDYDGPLRTSIRQLQRGLMAQDPRVLQHGKALYDGLIRYADRSIGDLMDFVTSTGLARNTCIILTSDHGEEFLEHGELLHGSDHLYEELLHVPLIVWCPSRFEGGRVVDGTVSVTDITPTILDIAGLPVPPAVQGRSLVGVLSGSRQELGRSVVSATELGVPPDQGSVIAISTDHARLIGSTRGTRPRELYDLVEDPNERVNLWSTRPDLAAVLAARLDQTTLDLEASASRPTPRADLDAAIKERLRALGYMQ